MFLLDTDALSELDKTNPNAGQAAWLESVDWLALHVSVITIAELWQGISMMPEGRKRRALLAMFNLLPDRFHNRIIPIDYSTAIKFGELQANAGPLPVLDALIAATALTRRLTLITHNVNDMARTGVPIFDPWST
jgi:predicted nucleic acid-binding protein